MNGISRMSMLECMSDKAVFLKEIKGFCPAAFEHILYNSLLFSGIPRACINPVCSWSGAPGGFLRMNVQSLCRVSSMPL